MNQQALDIYCKTCLRTVFHNESVETVWTCVNCNSKTVLPKNARFTQLFQECKIKLISSTQLFKMVEAYAKCQLEIVENSDNIMPVSLTGHNKSIQLNLSSAKYIPNAELEKMFLSSLRAIVAYR